MCLDAGIYVHKAANSSNFIHFIINLSTSCILISRAIDRPLVQFADLRLHVGRFVGKFIIKAETMKFDFSHFHPARCRMKPLLSLARLAPIAVLSLILPLAAAQDSTKTAGKAAVKLESGAPSVQKQAETKQPAALEKSPASQKEAVLEEDTAEHAASREPLPPQNVNSVENLRNEAARLRAEAKSLHQIADTLDLASEDAEKKAEDAKNNAEKLEEEIAQTDVQKAAVHIRMEMERINRLIHADVERIKRLHGVRTAGDSLYTLQADSLDSILAHISGDTARDIEKQRRLVQEIHANSEALMEKSHEMSAKARELEEAADKRDDMAEELAEKADKLAEEQNPLALSKRFPVHFGFQLRFTDVGLGNNNRLDVLLLHGMFATYSITQHIDAGLQDVTLYWQETMLGNRYAITAAPCVRLAFFPLKRLQMGAVGGVSVQGRVGCNRPAKASAAPFIALFNEFWVRNHFSISPTIRLNYAAYGPYYTVALSQHSGVLPQGALWIDLGIGYNFNF